MNQSKSLHTTGKAIDQKYTLSVLVLLPCKYLVSHVLTQVYVFLL